jgi:hypothetical protein
MGFERRDQSLAIDLGEERAFHLASVTILAACAATICRKGRRSFFGAGAMIYAMGGPQPVSLVGRLLGDANNPTSASINRFLIPRAGSEKAAMAHRILS